MRKVTINSTRMAVEVKDVFLLTHANEFICCWKMAINMSVEIPES
jgi:hypothetical protein